MTEFSLDLLLKAIKLARWTYYYHLKQLEFNPFLSNTREIILIAGFI
ncbi:degenerate transposase (Orf2) [Streptococcus pneumoniae]|nr:degenerate transposase (Orf2) [Streptococcus pneumoniae]